MLVFYFICALFLILFQLRKFYLSKCKARNNVSVLVLGDLGRSPRMQYHVLSFAKEGFTVDFIGYPGSLPAKEIRDNSHIRIVYMQPPPNLENNLPRMLCYIIKTLWQALTLSKVLAFKQLSKAIIIQNPPAIPTLPICWLYCTLTDTDFIVDWHNYAHTIMALTTGQNHFLVTFAKTIEMYFGSKAKINFCVSKAMKEDLKQQWGIEAHVLYDRPASVFEPITLEEKHNFLLKLSEKYDEFEGPKKNSTLFTEYISDKLQLCNDRPGLIVSSTSWTEDEDFSILMNALQEYERAIIQKDLKLPDLVCVITGKGPLKDFYLAIVELKKFKHIKIVTPWMKYEDKFLNLHWPAF